MKKGVLFCQRVRILSCGSLSFKERLAEEGVELKENEYVDMKKYQWREEGDGISG